MYLADAHSQPGSQQREQRIDSICTSVNQAKQSRGSSQVLHKIDIEVGNEETCTKSYQDLHQHEDEQRTIQQSAQTRLCQNGPYLAHHMDWRDGGSTGRT